MKEYKDLSDNEKHEVYNKAFTFLHDHADYVHSLFDRETPNVAPSGSDMFHPELWKGIHWVWFMKNINVKNQNNVDQFIEEKMSVLSQCEDIYD